MHYICVIFCVIFCASKRPLNPSTTLRHITESNPEPSARQDFLQFFFPFVRSFFLHCVWRPRVYRSCCQDFHCCCSRVFFFSSVLTCFKICSHIFTFHFKSFFISIIIPFFLLLLLLLFWFFFLSSLFS